MLRFACIDPHYVTMLVWGYFEPRGIKGFYCARVLI